MDKDKIAALEGALGYTVVNVGNRKQLPAPEFNTIWDAARAHLEQLKAGGGEDA